MAKKKKAATPVSKEFGNNPFSNLKGFAVSAPAEEKPQKSAPRQEKAATEAIGSFAEEMELLGVQQLNPSGEEREEENLESRPLLPEREKPLEPQNDEQLFLQSVGDLQVRFSDRLPEDEASVTASPRRMKQLKQGKLASEATLDLHGQQRVDVAGKISFFLQDAVYQGWRTVLIITGKGLHSEDGTAVLRSEAEQFLNAEGRKWVAEWGRAPRQYGGSGALVLFLRKS